MLREGLNKTIQILREKYFVGCKLDRFLFEFKFEFGLFQEVQTRVQKFKFFRV